MRQRPDRFLLADAARPRAARPRAGVLLAGCVLLAVCAILIVVLGVLFAGQSMADPFDRAVDGPVVMWFAGRQKLAFWLAYPIAPSEFAHQGAGTS